MVIINKKVQVIFGKGDISVQIGCLKDRSSGVVRFTEIEPMPIGEEITIDKKNMKFGEAPVTFIFNKIESLDAVIYQMQKLRDAMGADDKSGNS